MTAPQDLDDVTERLTAALGDAFTAFTSVCQQARDDELALTMSGLGGCTRQGAYRLARTPPSEPGDYREMRQANIGTMIHTGLLPLLADRTGGQDEIAVALDMAGLVISGRTDLYCQEWELVGDLKTIGTHKMNALGSDATHPHRVQVAGYATAIEQSGRPVRWIAWIYLCRDTGEEQVIVEPFGDELRDLVAQRCAELAAYADTPDSAPRDEHGPGLSIICDQCPWLRQCWGPDAVPGETGAQRILVHDNDGVADALRMYGEARAREAAAESDKKFARAMFAGYEPGGYGDWTFGWSAQSEVVDKDAAVALLVDAGIEPPRKKTGKKLIVKKTRTKPGNAPEKSNESTAGRTSE